MEETASNLTLVLTEDDESFSLETVEAEINEMPTKGKRIIPGRSKAAETVCLEAGCDFRCSRIPRLRQHLQSKHNIPQPKNFLSFDSEDDFHQWMSQMEQENHCTYMRRRGWQLNKNNSKSVCYYCHRGGLYISNASKKQSKHQGSCKTGVECTSSLKVTIWSPPTHRSVVEVVAYLQHYGHNLELGHTRIHWHDRKDIEKKLKNGISRHKILDEIRGSLDQTSNLSRVHLISLQDIYNIEKKCGIRANRGRYCSEAGITAQAWIEGMQQSEDNPVLLIKYQQETALKKYNCLGDDDFLLVLQTPLQSKMLQKHGPRQFMCIDIAHASSSKGGSEKEIHAFELFAVEVLLPNETKGKIPYPVAWCVSNRKDSEIINIFFNCVKENLKGFTLTPGFLFVPSFGITNGCDWFSIWCDTFGAGPRKLISSWHVMEEWRSNLQSKTSPALSSSERTRVLGNLETVIRESTAEHFVELVEECLEDLKTNNDTEEFASYFENNFMSQGELWASAYRTEMANAADMYLEIFHNRLSKNIYHEALKRKQLDILVKTLMKYTRDNVLPKLRNLHKGKNEFHQRSLTATIHSRSLEMSLDNVTPIEDKNEWIIMSVVPVFTDGISIPKEFQYVHYNVKIKTDEYCTARMRCPLRCLDCSACSHQMVCTCLDQDTESSSITSLSDEKMCVHMHQVCRYLSNKQNTTVEEIIGEPVLKKSQRDIKDLQHTVKQENGPEKAMNVIVNMESDETDIGEDKICKKKSIKRPSLVENATAKLLTLSVLRNQEESLPMHKKRKIIKLENMGGIYIVPSHIPTKIIIES